MAGVTLLQRALLNRHGPKVAFARWSPSFAQPGGAREESTGGGFGDSGTLARRVWAGSPCE